MYTKINGKMYLVNKLHYRYYRHTGTGIYTYYLSNLQPLANGYYIATYKHADGDSVKQAVTIF